MNTSEIRSFGEELRAIRERKRMSQLKLAQALGVNRQTIVAWELGKNPPKDRTRVLELGRILGLDDGEMNALLAAAFLDSLPPWHVPHHRNPFFTGRDEIIKALHTALIPGATAVLTQPHAISGLGGIGKTQTVVEYAYRYRHEYYAVLWLQADSPQIMQAEWIKLATVLYLPERDESEPARVSEAVRRWLSSHKKWLLILDNVTDLMLVEEMLPPGHQGCILLTTRSAVTEPIAYAYSLEKMTEHEAILFIMRRTRMLAPSAALEQIAAEHLSSAKALWELMDGLPLALDQAGAYILETGCSFSHYLDLYRQRRAELLKRRGKFPSGHPESVFTTFSLIFERVMQISDLAADLLQLCAFFYPEAIPEEIISQGAFYLGPHLQTITTDPLVLDQAIEVLRTYSLVERHASIRTLSIHRLVQAVLKDGMNHSLFQLWAERVVRVLNHLPAASEVSDWSFFQRYLPHLLEGATLAEQMGFAFPEAIDLIGQVGSYCTIFGQFKEAEHYLQYALHLYEANGIPINSSILSTFSNLAILYRRQGKYEQAEALYLQCLAICENDEGPDSLETAALLNNLAVVYEAREQYDRAQLLCERALSIRERALGPEHPRTVTTLNNLAGIYDEQGRGEEAERLYQRVLAIREQLLGPEHPLTSQTLNNLAWLYARMGKDERAEILYQRALAIIDSLGQAYYPDKAMVSSNLAELYQKQGRSVEAESLLLQALEIREQALEELHPDILVSLYLLVQFYREQGRSEQAEVFLRRLDAYLNQTRFLKDPDSGATFGLADPDSRPVIGTTTSLAEFFEKQGNYEQAERLYLQVLELHGQVAGLERPYAAGTVLGRLVNLYKKRNKYGQAEQLLQSILTSWEQALGRDHSLIAFGLFHLAMLYHEFDRDDLASPLLSRALAISESKLTSEHTFTGSLLKLMASIHERSGESEQAEQLYLRDLAIQEQALGSHHQDVASVLNSLALCYIKQNKYQQADPLLRRALTIYEQALGPQHLDYAANLNNLGLSSFKQGKFEQAEVYYQRALSIHQQNGESLESLATAPIIYNLGKLYLRQQRYDVTELLLLQGWMTWRSILGPAHLYTLNCAHDLIDLYSQSGQDMQAQLFISSVHPAGADQEEAEYLPTETVLYNLAQLFKRQGKYKQAELLSQRVLALHEQQFGSDAPGTAQCMNDLAIIYAGQRKYKQAEELFQRALALQSQILGPEHADTVLSLQNLGMLYFDRKQYEQAEPLLMRALQAWEKEEGDHSAKVALTCSHLAAIYQGREEHAQAELMMQKAQALVQEVNLDQRAAASILHNLGSLYSNSGRYKQAEELFLRSLEILQQVAPHEYSTLAFYLTNLGITYEKQGKDEQAMELFQRARSLREKGLE